MESIFTDREDGILYEGFKTPENLFDNIRYEKETGEYTLENSVKSLANAVIEIWGDKEKMLQYCQNARNHAKKTHEREQNYRRMQEIYADITAKNEA